MASKAMIVKTYKQILNVLKQENINVILKKEGEYKNNKTYSIPLSDGGEYEFYTYDETTKYPSIMGRFNNSPIIRDKIKNKEHNDKYNFHAGDCEELKTKFLNFLRYVTTL